MSVSRGLMARALVCLAGLASAPAFAQGPNFTELVERAGPSVVKIRVTLLPRSGRRRGRQGHAGVLPPLQPAREPRAAPTGAAWVGLRRRSEPGGPAAKAGVEAGDIIVSFDGRKVDKPSELSRLVANAEPGSKVTLQVFRRGAQRELSLIVGELEPKPRDPPDRLTTAPGLSML